MFKQLKVKQELDRVIRLAQFEINDISDYLKFKSQMDKKLQAIDEPASKRAPNATPD